MDRGYLAYQTSGGVTSVMDFESFCVAQIDRIERELFPAREPRRENAPGTETAEEHPAYTRDENAEDEWHPSTQG